MRYDWVFFTGNAVHPNGDRAGTDEDVLTHFYDAQGRWLGGYKHSGGGDNFEAGSLTSTYNDQGTYDLRNATTVEIALTDKGTHSPYWYPTSMTMIIDSDPNHSKDASLNEWIKPG